MGVLSIIKAIKQVHSTEIILVKIGDFYHVYGKDAYILAYLMQYKLKLLEEQDQTIPTCGFPEKSLSKIEANLENKKINYMLVDRRNNYEVDEITDYKNLNMYEKTYEKAYYYIKQKKRIDHLYEYLLQNIQKQETKNLLNEIEKKLK